MAKQGLARTTGMSCDFTDLKCYLVGLRLGLLVAWDPGTFKIVQTAAMPTCTASAIVVKFTVQIQ